MVKSKYISTPKQAIEHLAGSVKTGKDIAALKILAKEIEMMHHKDKAQHWLYAKLFLSIFNGTLQSSGTSKAGMDVIRFALQIPMEDHFKSIKNSFDTIRDLNAFKAEGVDLSHPRNESDKITPDQAKSLLNKISGPSIEVNEVKDILIEKINITLNNEINYE